MIIPTVDGGKPAPDFSVTKVASEFARIRVAGRERDGEIGEREPFATAWEGAWKGRPL
jgi:hypothetical protein